MFSARSTRSNNNYSSTVSGEVHIIFEDEYILVLDKPPGIVVDNSETQQGNTVESWLESRYSLLVIRQGIVHRLDKDTSGLLLVAKTTEALENLQKQFAGREVKKEYLALVHGEIKEPGVVDAPIIRNPENREKFTAVSPGRSQSPPSRWPNRLLEGAREAVTKYEPIKRLAFSDQRLVEIFPDYNKIQMRKLYAIRYTLFTLLRCFPKTGRTHQIRVHLKYIGFPIVSDEKYVGRKMYRLDKRFCPRQFLHAAKLAFRHPQSGEWMMFESSLPQDLKMALDYLSV